MYTVSPFLSNVLISFMHELISFSLVSITDCKSSNQLVNFTRIQVGNS